MLNLERAGRDEHGSSVVALKVYPVVAGSEPLSPLNQKATSKHPTPPLTNQTSIGAIIRTMRATLLLVTAIGVSACASGVPRGSSAPGCFSQGFHARVDGGLRGYADVDDVPGVSVGVVVNDVVVYEGSIGFANRKTRREATPTTLYNVASVTKAFTATLAILLATEGVIDLDAPVLNYLPDGVSVPEDVAGKPMTARHLLTHTAGLKKNPPNRRNIRISGPIDPGVWDTYDIPDLYAALAKLTVSGEFGKRHEYSNYGYALLGHILERAAKVPFEQLLRERILSPLGMSQTSISLSAGQEKNLAAFYWGDDPDRIERDIHARYGTVAAFIGLTSSVHDLVRFLCAQLATENQPGKVIPYRVMSQMRESYLDVDSDATYRFGRTLGWFVQSRQENSATFYFHSGEVDGHTAGLFLRPDNGVGVVVLQNLGGSDAEQALGRIGEWLVRISSDELSASSCRGKLAAAEANAPLHHDAH
jgi:CubicO group peptidase (beta-lactamase class C family)